MAQWVRSGFSLGNDPAPRLMSVLLRRLTLEQARHILETTDEELQKAWNAIDSTKNPRTRIAWMEYHDFLCDQLLAAHRVCRAVVRKAE